MNFTELEKRALSAAVESSRANGHDFGFTEDIVDAMDNPQQAGGVITSLSNKGVFEFVDSDGIETDSGEWHQFVLSESYRK